MYYGPETACSSFYFSCNHIAVALLALIFKLWRVPMRSSKLKYPASVRSRRLWQSHPVLALLAAYRTNCTFFSLFFLKSLEVSILFLNNFQAEQVPDLKKKKTHLRVPCNTKALSVPLDSQHHSAAPVWSHLHSHRSLRCMMNTPPVGSQ